MGQRKPVAILAEDHQQELELHYARLRQFEASHPVRLLGNVKAAYHSAKGCAVEAGGEWVDQAVEIDGQLISSRVPDELPACSRAILGALA